MNENIEPQPQGPRAVTAASSPETSERHVPRHEFRLGAWLLNLDAARMAWSLLSEQELIGSAGNEEHLTGLVEKRYGLSRRQANEQVKTLLHDVRAQQRR